MDLRLRAVYTNKQTNTNDVKYLINLGERKQDRPFWEGHRTQNEAIAGSRLSKLTVKMYKIYLKPI